MRKQIVFLKTAELAGTEWRRREGKETPEAFATAVGMKVAERSVLATSEVAKFTQGLEI